MLSFTMSLGLKYDHFSLGKGREMRAGLFPYKYVFAQLFGLDLKVSPFKWGWDLLRNFDLWDRRHSFTCVPEGGLSYYGGKGHRCPF